MMDDKGLVTAYLLDGLGGGTKIGWTEVQAWRPDQGVIWIHLDHNVEEGTQWLRGSHHLDDISVEALLAAETRPRSFTTEEGVLVILRGVNLNPNSDPEDMVSLRIWIKKNVIVTLRRRRLLAVNDISELLDKGCGPRSPSLFLAMISSRLVARMEPVLSSIEEDIDTLETSIDSLKPSEMRQKLGELRFTAISLKRYLQPQKDVMIRLQIDPHELIQMETKMELREVGDQLIRYIENLQEFRERAAVLQDEVLNQLSETANRTIYVLTIISAILLPLSFITGLLGINVGGIPGTDNEISFWVVCFLLTGVGVIIALFFRKLKWI